MPLKSTQAGDLLGTTAAKKVGLFGATPIVQPAAAAQYALTDNSGGATADGTIGAVTTFTPSVAWNGSNVYPSAADATAIAAAITALMGAVKELSTAHNQIRLDLVTLGVIKGSA